MATRSSIFRDINSLAHARTTINIGHPAIIIERGYWKPRGDGNDLEWRLAIDRFVDFARFRLSEISTRINGTFEELSNYHDAGRRFILRSDFVKISLVSDIFDEFWTSKIIVDYSYSRGPDVVLDYLVSLKAGLDGLEDLICKRLAREESVSGNGPHDTREETLLYVSQCSMSISTCISTLCNQIFDSINSPGQEVGLVEPSRRISINSKIPVNCHDDTSLFASFVGFSFGVDIATLKDGKLRRFENVSANSVIDNVGTSLMPEGDSDILRVIDAAWPVVKELNPYLVDSTDGLDDNGLEKFKERFLSSPNVNKSSRELTISRLNDGRGLYISSLGAFGGTEDDGHYPLSYLMISPHRATWQIGRMIERMHKLGTLRLAALVDYEKVEAANDDIRKLINIATEPRQKIEDISRRLDRIGSEIDGGLRYRMEWSRHYLRLFDNSMKMVRFGNVKGYQSYDKFIERKLGERFETINSASRRLDYLRLLVRDKVSQNTTASIKDILDFAELFSIFPIAYYSYYAIDYFNGGLRDIGIHAFESISWKFVWMIFTSTYSSFVLLKNRRWIARQFARLSRAHNRLGRDHSDG